MTLSDLPALNAKLNAVSTVFLLLGWWFIRHGRKRPHVAMMVCALTTSTCFLTSYLIYHAKAPVTEFTAHGIIRPVYFFILGTHMVLAAAIVPLVVTTVIFALRSRFERHRRLARWTLPIWLYVSVTGVLVYLILYQWYPPVASGAAHP